MHKHPSRVNQETEEGGRRFLCIITGAFKYYWEDLDIGNIGLNCTVQLYFQTATVRKKQRGIMFVIRSVKCEWLCL